MSPPLLELRSVQVQADGKRLLELEALDVREAETLVVLGPTGAGKSTLLRLMAGLEAPTRGELRWRGEALPVPWPLTQRRKVAMVFQAPLLFRGTVADNVAYGLRLRGGPRADVRQAVRRALKRFGIAELADRDAATLSGGEAHRTALARAVVLRPELLLLDEPLSSLDVETRERLRAELREIIATERLSCVHVTHDLGEARAMGDRVAVVIGGALVQQGPTDAPFRRPASLAVARLVGTRNLWPATLAPGGPRRVCVGPHELELTDAATVPSAENVVACLPAELVWLETAGAPLGELRAGSQHEHRLDGRVLGLRAQGPNVEVTLECGVELVALVTPATVASLALGPGSAARACFPREALHLVAGES